MIVSALDQIGPELEKYCLTQFRFTQIFMSSGDIALNVEWVGFSASEETTTSLPNSNIPDNQIAMRKNILIRLIQYYFNNEGQHRSGFRGLLTWNRPIFDWSY